MVKSSSSQNGSTHTIVIIAAIVAVLGVLGYVFWNNFLIPKTQDKINVPINDSNSTKNHPKSSVISLENSDMNKYINYNNGFQFLFPKQIYTFNDCELSSVKYDNYGNTTPSESRYGGASGPVSVVILESGDDYIIVPEKTVVLSNAKGTPGAGYIFKDCDVLSTNLGLVTESQKDNFGFKNIALENRTIKVATIDSKDKVLEFAKGIFGDPKGTIAWISDPANGRDDIEFKHDPSTEWRGGGAYKLWYYPAQKRIVYIGMGQSQSLQHPDGSDQYYFDQVVDSFKFSTE